jgi:HPt (histidine-containing phosphotransfer) domain-containing protein
MGEEQTAAPLDRSDLEQVSLGDVDFEREILHEFLTGSAALLATLSAAVAARDGEQLRRAAHSLKGSCWTVGAKPLGTACERLELDARAGKLDAATHLLGEIGEQLARLEAYVRRHWTL